MMKVPARIALLLVATMCVCYALGAWRTAQSARQVCDARLHAADDAHREALAAATERVRVAEAALQARLTTIYTQHHQEMADAKARHDRLVTGLRAGTVRMSIPVASCSNGGAAGAADPAAASTETRAELAPAAGAALAAIAADGDAAILDLNACIDAYTAARAAVSNTVREEH